MWVIPPLVSLLLNGSSRGKDDALTMLYKLCSTKLNKDRVFKVRTMKLVVERVTKQGSGMAKKVIASGAK